MSNLSIISFAKEKIEYIFNNNEKYIRWGNDNKEPIEYLDLYENVVEHSSSINFILNNLIVDGIEEIDFWLLQKITLDYLIFGGFSLEIIKKRNGSSLINYIDISKLRYSTNKKMIGYSDNWYNYKVDIKWKPISNNIKEDGIFLFKNPKARYDYPNPYWYSSETNLKTMKNIIEYHYNNSENGFTPSVIINFNNGEPDDDTKKQYEKGISGKFTGTKGKKFLLNWNNSKETATTIEKLEADNLDEKFQTLQKFLQEQIFISHQITSPMFIGKLPENQGFSKTEYQEAMEIFMTTTIANLRREIEYGLSLLKDKEIKLKIKE